MAVVAAAVGVASCFGAPISGKRASKGLTLWIHLIYQLVLLVHNCCHFQYGSPFHTHTLRDLLLISSAPTPPHGFRLNRLSRLPLIFITSLPNSLIPSLHYSFYFCNIIKSLAPQVQISHSQIGVVIIDIRKTLNVCMFTFFCCFITSFFSVFFSSSCPPPVGVLFSVEVMCSHFPLKHYFPCFFSAACGTLTFRLFSVWSGDIGKADSEQHSPPHGQQGQASLLSLWGNMTRPEN